MILPRHACCFHRTILFRPILHNLGQVRCLLTWISLCLKTCIPVLNSLFVFFFALCGSLESFPCVLSLRMNKIGITVNCMGMCRPFHRCRKGRDTLRHWSAALKGYIYAFVFKRAEVSRLHPFARSGYEKMVLAIAEDPHKSELCFFYYGALYIFLDTGSKVL